MSTSKKLTYDKYKSGHLFLVILFDVINQHTLSVDFTNVISALDRLASFFDINELKGELSLALTYHKENSEEAQGRIVITRQGTREKELLTIPYVVIRFEARHHYFRSQISSLKADFLRRLPLSGIAFSIE